MSEIPSEFPFVIAGRFDVIGELGRGGFAVVYHARDRQMFGRDVAIKLLRDDTFSQSAMRRFSREIHSQSRLEHPNILQIYDTGSWDGRVYYVMQFVRGATLETRLATEGVLQLADAFSIAREVGLALSFAHKAGVVHRDVKPANILLGPGGALLGDFGIARLRDDTLSDRITSAGFAVGTTRYMSPEQLCAEPDIDGRSDQYSLALICYEMLTGVRPHIAATADGLRALRLAGSIAPIATHRPSVPTAACEGIERALSPSPADRFRDVDEFLRTLEWNPSSDRQSDTQRNSPSRSSPAGLPGPVGEHGLPTRRAWLSRIAIGTSVFVGLGAAGAYYFSDRGEADAHGARADDTPSVAFLAPRTRGDSAFEARLRDELDGWSDIVVRADKRTDASAFEGDGSATWRDIARSDKTTLFIKPTVADVGDSVRWTVTVYDARSARVARLVRMRARSADLDRGMLRDLSAHLLVGATADSSPGIATLNVPSLSAARAYARGWQLLRAGALESARAEFLSSVSIAPSFAHGHLWAAQTGAWLTPKVSPSWRDEAQRANALSGSLRGVDSLFAGALAAIAAGDQPRACSMYRLAAVDDPDSFQAWYGLGQCQHVDSAVVRDARVPGGLRFRSSHWSALAAYEKALSKLPDQRMARLFVPVVAITYASGNQTRRGLGVRPDTSLYFAIPSLDGDSVQTLPVPSTRVIGRSVVPESFSRALRRARQTLLDLSVQWVGKAPLSPDAWFYHAYALELLGKYDALDAVNSASGALARADSLSRDDQFRGAIDVARVRVAVRRGSFDDAIRLARLALSRPGPISPRVAALRAPLAAFLGDVDATVAMLRIASSTTVQVERAKLPEWAASTLPVWLADSLRAFGVRATLGVCDGLKARQEALERDFAQHVAAAEHGERRITLLRDVYRAAVPCLGAAVWREFKPDNPLDRALTALALSDPSHARKELYDLESRRRGMSISTVTEDALLMEAWVLEQTGDSVAARSRVRANMNDLASISAFTFDDVSQAAALALVRRMASKH